MRKIRNLLFVGIIMSITQGCKSDTKAKAEVMQLPGYPSASGIEFNNGRFYIIGDDANSLLVLDSNFSMIDSVKLYSFAEKRIPKSIKADLEAITVLQNNKLLVTGSGSFMPNRNMAWLIDPAVNQEDSIRLDTFYLRLQSNGIKEMNLEGVTAIPGSIIFSNRGSKGYPKNDLVITEDQFWNNQEQADLRIIPVRGHSDTTVFNGVSGLAYARTSDMLLMTVSTEDTRNSMDDGAIGKSYLWIVKNISLKKTADDIIPDMIIDLDKTDPLFKGQKIESVCIRKETDNLLYLLLAADNDNGSSSLFKLVVQKN